MMDNETSPLGDVVNMAVEYSEGRVNPNVSEIEWNDDGADLMVSADGDDFIYGASGNSSVGDDFFNADADTPDSYMPDSGADGEEYSYLTLWSKKKRKAFGKKVQKTIDKGKKAIGQIGALTKGIAPQEGEAQGDMPSEPIIAPVSAPKTSTPKKKMSTGLIVGIGVGVVAVGALIWYLTKSGKSGK